MAALRWPLVVGLPLRFTQSMNIQMFCKDEKITPWKTRMNVEHRPLTLILDDRSQVNPMAELVELRIEDQAEQDKWAGKCKNHTITIGVLRLGKFNGIARIDGTVLSVDGK